MHWIAATCFACFLLLATIWIVFRAAVAKLSRVSLQYPCLPRRDSLAPSQAQISRREARRRAGQRARTMQKLQDLARPQKQAHRSEPRTLRP
jgi:hypothetical protein